LGPGIQQHAGTDNLIFQPDRQIIEDLYIAFIPVSQRFFKEVSCFCCISGKKVLIARVLNEKGDVDIMVILTGENRTRMRASMMGRRDHFTQLPENFHVIHE
jgi:hypothetical protein